MIKMWIRLGWEIGRVLVIFLVSFGMSYLVTQKWVAPIIEDFLDKMENVDKTSTNLAKLAQIKGGEVQQVKAAEKMIVEDLFENQLENYPEIEAFLSVLSPRVADYLKENPHVILALYERWGPKIEALMEAQGLYPNKGGRVRRYKTLR